ncbi:hypothetical protein FNV43_RR16817 [Rhamnella rubrinervis]|uniref:Legume lectin domain-containing protein n=1 Tax=Rhamnella rubrinervis TaxID=2594499 RepID=A0A8K0GZI4_9ROSA|nr:hypothetical protein FNV43_RR16817 [Rhamnella rubrinervis]
MALSVFMPSTGIQGVSTAQHQGFLNRTNDGSLNSHAFVTYWITKTNSWSFKEIKLNDRANYRVWIKYSNTNLKITLPPENKKQPQRPLINVPLDLSDVFHDEMYVGFTASIGEHVQNHKILKLKLQ